MRSLSAAPAINDQFFASSLSVGRATERIVIAPEDCWITFLHVRPNEQVVCGEALCDIAKVQALGRSSTDRLVAPDYGVVRPMKGAFPLFFSFVQKPVAVFVQKNTPLFIITREKTRREAGTIRGLTPRPTRVMWLRRQRLLKSYLRPR
jgi:hypothetical protein